MKYRGFYINLDRSTDRREEMEVHLISYGLADRYQRFSAVEGKDFAPQPPHLTVGEVGCFASHTFLLKENLGSSLPLHVIEDDVLLSSFTAPVIQSLIANNSFDVYDIVYLDTFVTTSPVLYKKYYQLYRENVRRDGQGKIEADFQLIDMQNVEFASTASMMISPRAITKLCELYVDELARGPEAAIDLFIRRKAKENVIRVGCIFPFVTSLRLERVMDTTLGDADLRLTALATVMARHAFFVEADWNKCLEYAARYLTASSGDAQRQVLTQILGFALDDRFNFT